MLLIELGEQVVVAHYADPVQRQHEPLIDLRHERHIVGGLCGRPASVVVAAASALRPANRCERSFGRLDHSYIPRELMLQLIVRGRLDHDYLTCAVVNFEPRRRLSHHTLVQPAVNTELPENFRMIADPARYLHVPDDVASILLEEEVWRAHDFTVPFAELCSEAKQRLIDHGRLPADGLQGCTLPPLRGPGS